ncbi:hypothetical protein JYU34_012946 [Plutella xylostella]|uniref:Uncharacterized protein n=1 Tax=Plutella xylostella TaxID=51655 RepID=A0ABQ7QCJ6_PLUXY|nr:hypothetical protein JYU34_012946 [Plutella xylostella]
MKPLFYASSVAQKTKRQRIVDAFAGIDPPMIRRVGFCAPKHQAVYQQQGRHIEPFL